jgi:hypothetical protein
MLIRAAAHAAAALWMLRALQSQLSLRLLLSLLSLQLLLMMTVLLPDFFVSKLVF